MSAGTLERGQGSLVGVGRIRLRYRSWEAPQPRTGILLVHGLAEHGGRYETFAESLARGGCSVFALDLRGHGRSDGRRGHTASFDLFLQDLERFRREIQGAQRVDGPLFLIGHSMGGLITLRYLQEFQPPVRGAVIVSPWLATAVPVPRWKEWLARILEHVLPAMPFRTTIRPEDLCRNSAVVAAYREDPLVHHTITPRLYAEAGRAREIVRRRTDRIRTPLLFLIAGEDRIVNSGSAERFARTIDGDVTVCTFPGRYHELLFEPDREPVLKTLRGWIADRAA